MTIDDEDEEEIIERRRRERHALMSKLNATSAQNAYVAAKVFEVISAGTDVIEDDRDSEDEEEDDDNGALSDNGYDNVSNDSPGKQNTVQDKCLHDVRSDFLCCRFIP